MKKIYTASVREKGQKHYINITSPHTSMRAFAKDLRANGYAVQFIAVTDSKYSKEYQDAEKRYYKRRFGKNT